MKRFVVDAGNQGQAATVDNCWTNLASKDASSTATAELVSDYSMEVSNLSGGRQQISTAIQRSSVLALNNSNPFAMLHLHNTAAVDGRDVSNVAVCNTSEKMPICTLL